MRTDGHDEVNSRFSQIFERVKNEMKNSGSCSYRNPTRSVKVLRATSKVLITLFKLSFVMDLCD